MKTAHKKPFSNERAQTTREHARDPTGLEAR
jgi:hypothetical protein